MTDFLNTLPLISYEQKKRLKKAFGEPLYLLEASFPDPEYHFRIVGSTKNVYLIKIDDEGKISCDCPDFSTYCVKNRCICKHCCFVISKVGKLNNESYYKPGSKPIELADKQKIYNNCTMAHIDKSLLDKYNALRVKECDSDTIEEKDLSSEQEHSIDDLLNGETDCPICFSELKDDNGTISLCSNCPQCNKYLHTDCILKWLNYNSSCVFCRFKWTPKHFQKNSSKKPSPSNYVNLL